MDYRPNEKDEDLVSRNMLLFDWSLQYPPGVGPPLSALALNTPGAHASRTTVGPDLNNQLPRPRNELPKIPPTINEFNDYMGAYFSGSWYEVAVSTKNMIEFISPNPTLKDMNTINLRDYEKRRKLNNISNNSSSRNISQNIEVYGDNFEPNICDTTVIPGLYQAVSPIRLSVVGNPPVKLTTLNLMVKDIDISSDNLTNREHFLVANFCQKNPKDDHARVEVIDDKTINDVGAKFESSQFYKSGEYYVIPKRRINIKVSNNVWVEDVNEPYKPSKDFDFKDMFHRVTFNKLGIAIPMTYSRKRILFYHRDSRDIKNEFSIVRTEVFSLQTLAPPVMGQQPTPASIGEFKLVCSYISFFTRKHPERLTDIDRKKLNWNYYKIINGQNTVAIPMVPAPVKYRDNVLIQPLTQFTPSKVFGGNQVFYSQLSELLLPNIPFTNVTEINRNYTDPTGRLILATAETVRNGLVRIYKFISDYIIWSSLIPGKINRGIGTIVYPNELMTDFQLSSYGLSSYGRPKKWYEIIRSEDYIDKSCDINIKEYEIDSPDMRNVDINIEIAEELKEKIKFFFKDLNNYGTAKDVEFRKGIKGAVAKNDDPGDKGTFARTDKLKEKYKEIRVNSNKEIIAMNNFIEGHIHDGTINLLTQKGLSNILFNVAKDKHSDITNLLYFSKTKEPFKSYLRRNISGGRRHRSERSEEEILKLTQESFNRKELTDIYPPGISIPARLPTNRNPFGNNFNLEENYENIVKAIYKTKKEGDFSPIPAAPVAIPAAPGLSMKNLLKGGEIEDNTMFYDIDNFYIKESYRILIAYQEFVKENIYDPMRKDYPNFRRVKGEKSTLIPIGVGRAYYKAKNIPPIVPPIGVPPVVDGNIREYANIISDTNTVDNSLLEIFGDGDKTEDSKTEDIEYKMIGLMDQYINILKEYKQSIGGRVPGKNSCSKINGPNTLETVLWKEPVILEKRTDLSEEESSSGSLKITFPWWKTQTGYLNGFYNVLWTDYKNTAIVVGNTYQVFTILTTEDISIPINRLSIERNLINLIDIFTSRDYNKDKLPKGLITFLNLHNIRELLTDKKLKKGYYRAHVDDVQITKINFVRISSSNTENPTNSLYVNDTFMGSHDTKTSRFFIQKPTIHNNYISKFYDMNPWQYFILKYCHSYGRNNIIASKYTVGKTWYELAHSIPLDKDSPLLFRRSLGNNRTYIHVDKNGNGVTNGKNIPLHIHQHNPNNPDNFTLSKHLGDEQILLPLYTPGDYIHVVNNIRGDRSSIAGKMERVIVPNVVPKRDNTAYAGGIKLSFEEDKSLAYNVLWTDYENISFVVGQYTNLIIVLTTDRFITTEGIKCVKKLYDNVMTTRNLSEDLKSNADNLKWNDTQAIDLDLINYSSSDPKNRVDFIPY